MVDLGRLLRARVASVKAEALYRDSEVSMENVFLWRRSERHRSV